MDFNKKEMPIQGFTGFGGGATGAAFRGAADETKYIDEVFMTNVWIGTGSSNEIDNGVKLSSKGGMVWVKNREENDNNWLFANASGFNFNGIGNAMRSNSDGGKYGSGSSYMTSFDSDGFTVGTHGSVNGSGDDIVAWTFRNSKAFQTLTYEGNGSVRTINHNLGSVPGMVMVKKTDGSDPWYVWHRNLTDNTKVLNLNETYGESGNADVWNSTAPTATNFTLGTYSHTNQNGSDYIAYIFAGGESDAATARSVEFDGNDKLYLSANSSIDVNNGDFTIECWFNVTSNSTHQSFITDWDNFGWQVEINTDGKCQFAWGPNSTAYWSIVGQQIVAAGTWNHIAVVRSGNVFTQYLNGIYDGTFTSSATGATHGTVNIGYNNDNGANRYVTGNISNVRIVKGTAVYTSSFKPPTEPLTNITNTGLLCCNNSSVTGSTVAPGTISSGGDPTASTDSPFDDPDGFAFGEDEDEGIFKCGSYIGNGSAIGPDVYLGWQPQYVMIKRIDASREWVVYDAMRGIVSAANDAQLRPDSSTLEYSYARIDLTPTGFKPMTNNADTNTSGGTYVYFCVRSQDGYVGKPAEAGTDVFDIEFGSGGSAEPAYVGGFPVDFGISRELYQSGTTNPTNAGNYTGARLTGQTWLATHDNSSEQTGVSDWIFDSNTGWAKNYPNNYISWMWKRHKGMDVVCFRGNSANRQIAHGLNAVPEMIIVKQRTSSTDWQVYHKGLNGGTNPEQYRMVLNSYAAEQDDNTAWNDTAPTATHFSLGTMNEVNNNGEDLIAFLFTSVEGISKCGYYNGSNSDQTITLGFQPRFFMCKARDEGSGDYDWLIMDSVRGLVGASCKQLYLNLSSSQDSENFVDSVSSTGITLQGIKSQCNFSGREYIYYAHA